MDIKDLFKHQMPTNPKPKPVPSAMESISRLGSLQIYMSDDRVYVMSGRLGATILAKEGDDTFLQALSRLADLARGNS